MSLLFLPACEKKPSQGAGTTAVQVSVITIEPKTIPFEIEKVGMTQASQSVEIRSRVEGWLLKRPFEEGKRVLADQVLYEIDPKPFQADLEIAKAQLAQAQARLASADRDVVRLTRLVEQNAGNRKELDDALTSQLQAQADIRLYQARVTKAELDLSYTTIRAPFQGVIGKSEKDLGALVDPSANSLLAKITRLDPIYVNVTFSEAEGLNLADDIQAGRLVMAPGQERVEVSIRTVDGRPYDKTGQINFKAPEIDPQTGSAQVRAEIPNPQHKLSPGQFVRAKFTGFQRPNAITLPQRCVMQSPAGAFVYVVKSLRTQPRKASNDVAESTVVETRSVVTAETVGQSWVIDQGLAPGDQVIYDGVQKVRPGMNVQIVPLPPLSPSPATSAPSQP